MANYYGIDDILAEEELIPVVFQKAATGVGLLDPSSETNNIEQGAKVELPFWLAHELHTRQAVVMNIPPCFNQMTRKEILADPASVDLRGRCQYFYELGCKITPLVGDKTIGSFLLYALKNRYKEVLSKAHTATFITATKPLTLLTKEETHLCEAAQSSMAAFKKWRIGGSRFEVPSVLGKKRKPSD
ncbi:DNA replication complex GINS protein PSF3-like [Amaranthus tricolor]|uniref:DNA replication complex GINS protein PSF3-like n=1 Tax=Amaranthus tricolor TaxID=29722 RepID=UPI00259069A6|nr:DNA replication complex GINS protein PSF3-like [Amaranthus tricolor]